MTTRDLGPIYAETDWSATIKEPFNATTALLYVVLAVVWLVRLHPVRDRYRFLYVSMWGLLVGGVGGTIYHAFRAHWVFLMLDALPIVALGLATAVYAIRQLTSDWLWVLAPLVGLVAIRSAVGLWLPSAYAINVGYALLGLAIITPLMLLALRTRHGLWTRVVPATGLFAGALLCRSIDLDVASTWSHGTHGFWHLFAAGAVALLIQFFWEVRSRRIDAVGNWNHPLVTGGGPTAPGPTPGTRSD